MITGIFEAIIDIIPNVANIYAIVCFLLLACIYLFTHFHIGEPPNWLKSLGARYKLTAWWQRQLIVIILILSVIITVGLWASNVASKAMYEGKVYIVRDEQQVRINKRVQVQLIDITTLKEQQYNRTLGDDEVRERIYKKVFEKAEIWNFAKMAEDALSMNEEQWKAFLEQQTQFKRSRVQYIPFVKFCVYVDGEEAKSFRNRYYFKGERIQVKAMKVEPIIEFELSHVYDTYHYSSGEPETVVINLIK